MLVVFDDTALIWQIKDLKVDENGRYKDAEVEKNLRQLSGAKRTWSARQILYQRM
jgi:hypothetical protein